MDANRNLRLRRIVFYFSSQNLRVLILELSFGLEKRVRLPKSVFILIMFRHENTIMPTQIEIQADVADRLFAIARMRGVSVDVLLREILSQLDKTVDSSNHWQLRGSIELLDEDLKDGSRQIAKGVRESLSKTSQRA